MPTNGTIEHFYDNGECEIYPGLTFTTRLHIP
jgi:hypothetical protein